MGEIHWPAGAPASEFTRSPAAARVGQLAAEAGLFLFHYEHRVRLDQDVAWQGGVLPEPKYNAFRHDLAIGSFHPGHRAKWTTHELCHALVGFGWCPNPSPLYLATAGRLAELLPVVLYYFLDEIRLRRCDVHQGGGALFRDYCPDCEAVAATMPDDPDAARFLAEAERFMDRELAAVARTRRLGRPVPHQWATLNLCSDGLAYAHSHGPRLQSEAFERYAEALLVEGGGWTADLDVLEARVVEVFRGLAYGESVAPLVRASSTRWIRQDLAQRLMDVAADTDGEAHDALLALMTEPVAGMVAGYQALCEEWVLPPVEAVLAVGYDVPGTPFGRSVDQVRAGLHSAMPQTMAEVEREVVAAFVAEDVPVRLPLARRFAEWLDDDDARFEAACAHVRADPDGFRLGLEGEGLALAPGVEVFADGRVVHRAPDGDVLAVEVEPGALDDLSALDAHSVEALLGLGILVRERWRV